MFHGFPFFTFLRKKYYKKSEISHKTSQTPVI